MERSEYDPGAVRWTWSPHCVPNVSRRVAKPGPAPWADPGQIRLQNDAKPWSQGESRAHRPPSRMRSSATVSGGLPRE